jgi:Domain of unknown function (DUF4335)
MSSPLTRTYTPPTCTLEVTAQPSALSRWSNTPVVKSLQFILNLEGLARGDREPVALRGDQTQLAALSEAVSSHVQRLVSSRHTELPLKAPEQPTAPSPAAAESGLFDEVEAPPIHLRSRTLLTHELVLGDLATPESGNSVILKVSQLYDLATALSDCAADLQQLPVATPAAATSPRRIPAWAKTAAAIAVTAGVGTATWQLLQLNQPSLQQASRSPSPSQPTIVGVAPPPLPETRPRQSVKLPTVTLPDRSQQPSILARSNSGDRSTAGNNDLFSAKPGTPSNKPATPEKPVKFDPLPPEPAPISPNIPESAISMRGNDTASSAGADTAAPAASSQTSGAESNTGVMAESSQAISAATARAKQGPASGSSPFNAAPAPAAVIPRPATEPSQQTKPGANAREGLFDITPQVLEARQTIAQSQKTTPSRVVEYRLTVSPNGSLAAIEPLGQAAQQYLPKLSLAVGQPFVSAPGQRSQIRLVVRPDGTVQTFPEGVGN